MEIFKTKEQTMTDEEFDRASVIACLKKMFRPDGYFNTCDLNKCLATLNIIPPKYEMRPLEALHCISWNDMDKKLRKEVFIRTLNLFRHRGFQLSEIDVIDMLPNNEGKNIFKMLK